MCRHTKPAKTFKTAKTVNGLGGCVAMPVFLRLFWCHCGWEQPPEPSKPSKPPKPSNATPLRPPAPLLDKNLVTRPKYPPYRETRVAIPLSHCVSCGIADYRCYTPTSFRKNGLSQSKDRLQRGGHRGKTCSQFHTDSPLTTCTILASSGSGRGWTPMKQ